MASPGGLGLLHRALDPIGYKGDQRIFGGRRIRWPVTWHENRDAMMVSAPVIRQSGRVTGRGGREPARPRRMDSTVPPPSGISRLETAAAVRSAWDCVSQSA